MVIPCNLNDFTGPIYWLINDLIYDLYSVPGYIIYDFSAIILPRVGRRLNGYTFQCFTFVNSERRLGDIIHLTVLFGMVHRFMTNVCYCIYTEPGEPSIGGGTCDPTPLQQIQLEFENYVLNGDSATIFWNSTECSGNETVVHNKSRNADPCMDLSSMIEQTVIPVNGPIDSVTVDNVNSSSLLRVLSSNPSCNSPYFAPFFDGNQLLKFLYHSVIGILLNI